jgi:hypothetical protein
MSADCQKDVERRFLSFRASSVYLRHRPRPPRSARLAQEAEGAGSRRLIKQTSGGNAE